MNSVVIIFVPTDAKRQDFKAALRASRVLLENGESSPRTKPDEFEKTDSKELPLWTWFLPNPCPRLFEKSASTRILMLNSSLLSIRSFRERRPPQS